MGKIRELIKSLIPASDSVFERSAKSAVWMTGVKWASRVSEILLLIVLARLLAPRDFGLMGIALLSLAGISRFTQIGLNQALIQQKDENVDGYLDTTWCLEAGRGLLLFVVVFVSAPYIASFFGEPGATRLIQAIGLSPLLIGLKNPGVVYFRKSLSFHKEFAYEVSSKFVRLLVGVAYALVSPTVWALVFAFLASDLTRFVLSYVLHSYRPWPSFDRAAAYELIDFGKWITASSIINFIYSRGDDVFVGWFLSATALGFYQYAYRIADMPSTEISEVIANVTFPAYSRLQDEPEQLRNALLRSLRIVGFATYPVAFGIALVAPSFVPVVLGPDWTPMIVTMQLLAVYGLLHALTRNFGSIWKAIDRPDITAKVGLIRVLCIATLIWPATARWGIEGTAAVVVGVYIFPMLPLDVYWTAKVTEVEASQVFREYLFPLVPAATMFGVLWYARGLYEISHLVELIVLIPAGAVVYFAVSFFIWRGFDWGIDEDIFSIVRALKN